MPTISVFYGIQIMMYFYDQGKHKTPHIHAEYQDDEAVFSILDGDILSGNLLPSASKIGHAEVVSNPHFTWPGNGVDLFIIGVRWE